MGERGAHESDFTNIRQPNVDGQWWHAPAPPAKTNFNSLISNMKKRRQSDILVRGARAGG